MCVVAQKQTHELSTHQTELGGFKHAESTNSGTKARLESELAALLKEKQTIEESKL